MADCTCGRSPNGKCIGWHSLTEDQYTAKKEQYELRKQQREQNDERLEE
jgi:hypothetical protein